MQRSHSQISVNSGRFDGHDGSVMVEKVKFHEFFEVMSEKIQYQKNANQDVIFDD